MDLSSLRGPALDGMSTRRDRLGARSQPQLPIGIAPTGQDVCLLGKEQVVVLSAGDVEEPLLARLNRKSVQRLD